MRIPAWMITEEMKQTKHYRMYVEVFGLDVPLTQSQPTESTQGTHRTTSAPRSPNPITEAAESSAPKRSTVIHFCLSKRRSTRLTPPAPVPTVDKANEMLLQDTLQVSLAEHKSREEQEARENVALVNEHLASVEIDKLVDDSKNVVDDSSPPRNDDTTILGTRLEPRSDKESPEVEITKEKEVEITKETEVEFVAKTVELTRVDVTNIVSTYQVPVYLVEGLILEIKTTKEETKRLISKAILEERGRMQAQLSLFKMQLIIIPSLVDASMKFEKTQRGGIVEKAEDIWGDYEAYVSWRAQDDEFDFWTDFYASDDDEIPTKQVTQDIMEEISLTIDEAKLKKMVDSEMLRQRCTLGDEHQYHIDQNENFLQSGHCLGKQKAILISSASMKDHDHSFKAVKEIVKLTLSSDQSRPFTDSKRSIRNSKDVQVIKTYWELGHEHKFITEIVARRANDCIVSITEPDYKNLNKNDIEDMYLLIVNNKVPDYANTGLLWSLSVFIRSSVIWERVHDFQLGIESYQQKINLTAPIITFPGIEEYDVFSIVYEPVHGIIYTNSKKEKRVMRPSKIHKFCDATLRRTLEGLKSYYNDVKYGYVQKELTNDEVEFLKLFEEEIEV
ncbi:hypothetical protein Tco_1032855 [Tanacetum coccineum]|uniref:Uncharacterized protein n=1 Tax=Tanacetum coccineum TaxID=301880 RepID=A0ABQ5GD83_9ASTR